MHLEGQHAERGYAMAALLVALAVMGVLMSAALPAWRHQAKREKEAELVFRGEQYVRAIRLWEMKTGPGSRPPTIDVLVQQKFLRKKYKDPMTQDGEFQLLFAGVTPLQGRGGRGMQGQQLQLQPQPQQEQQPQQERQPQRPQAQPPQPPQFGRGGPPMGAGIIGVTSKSTEPAIRIYKGGTHYNQWRFIHAGMQNTPGGVPGSRLPGGRGRGAPGMGPGSQFPGPGRGGPFGPGGRGSGGRPPGSGGPGRGRGQ